MMQRNIGMTVREKITSAELIRNFGPHADRARAGQPVRITKYGRDDLVLVSASDYDRMKRRDREAVFTVDATPDVIEAIRDAEPPKEAYELDHLVPEDWQG
jgi:prevent-host-death family protein